MPRDLFGDLQQPAVRVGSQSRYTVPLSLAAHAAIILSTAAATILAPVVLPGLASDEITYITMPPAPPPPAAPVPTTPLRPPINPNAAPVEAPPAITPEAPRQFELPDVPAAMTGVVPGVSTIDTGVSEPPPPPPLVDQKPVRPGAGIRPPVKVHDVAPIYSPAALAARIQGTVIIEATIGADGRVQAARILRSPPLLDEAALTAVRQWVYTPTLLNGVAVPVIMTVTVVFRLN